MFTAAPLRTLLALIVAVLFFPKNANAGIVLNAFTGINTDLVAYADSDPTATFNGEGLLDSSSDPTNIHNSDYLHATTTNLNSWIFQVDQQVGPAQFDVFLKLEGLQGTGGLTGVDGYYLWNQNAGDSKSAGATYAGNSGVQLAELYYTTDVTLDFTDVTNLQDATWEHLWTGSFWKETGDTSYAQVVTGFDPFFASYLKLRLATAWGTFPTDSVDVVRIGFAELAYSEYVAPAPPVVPEPGSIAVFGGLMAAGGLMRWRRRRSVGG